MRRVKMAITYDKFFRITNCDTIIFLEDDFAFKNSKESLFYGLARLNGNSRERLYVELKDAGADFVDELQEYLGMILKRCSQLLKEAVKMVAS